jgi:hypothetical protein
MFCDICRFGNGDIRRELVSLSSDGHDQSGVFRVVTQRLAQMRDVLCQVAFFYEGFSPRGLQQFLFRGFAPGREERRKALGVRETGESARDSVRFRGSSAKGPKGYK